VSAPQMRARAILRSFLGAPLWVKLIGANALIVAMAAIILTRTTYHDREFHVLSGLVFAALIASTAVTIALVIVALRPLRLLERAAAEVWRGNTSARVPYSMLADRDMARVGHTINLLVDQMVQDSARSRELAAFVISQAESDQARIAYELHESSAQRLAAQVMQLSAIGRDTGDANTRMQLDELREATADTLEQLRRLVRTMNAHTVSTGTTSFASSEDHGVYGEGLESLTAR
jgi:signal transduction histidine kinase